MQTPPRGPEFGDVCEIVIETCWDLDLQLPQEQVRLKRACRAALDCIDSTLDYGRIWGDLDPNGAEEVRSRLRARRALQRRPEAGQRDERM